MYETVPVPVLVPVPIYYSREVVIAVEFARFVPTLGAVLVKLLRDAITVVDGTWTGVDKELITGYVGIGTTGNVLTQDLFNGVGHSLTTTGTS